MYVDVRLICILTSLLFVWEYSSGAPNDDVVQNHLT